MLVNKSAQVLWLSNISTKKDVNSSAAAVFNQVLANAMNDSAPSRVAGPQALAGAVEGGASTENDSVSYDAFANSLYNWKENIADWLKEKEKENSDAAGGVEQTIAVGEDGVPSTINQEFAEVEADPANMAENKPIDEYSARKTLWKLLEMAKNTPHAAGTSASSPMFGVRDDSSLLISLEKSASIRANGVEFV